MALFFRDDEQELNEGEEPDDQSRLDAVALRTLGGLNQESEGGSDRGIDEITFNDYEHDTADGRTIATEANLEDGMAGSSFSGAAGGKVGTWGTGA